MLCDLFIRLLLAHIIGDFVLQSDEWCRSKLKYGLRSYHIYIHALIIFSLSWFILWSWSAWWVAIIIGFTHLVIDAFKKHDGLQPFLWDQVAHIVILLVSGYVALKKGLFAELCCNTYYVMCIVVFLLNAKPANILIKLLLRTYSVNISDTGESQERDLRIQSGKLIGNIERWLIIIFILCQQYEVIGFLIAGKSIIRYKEGDTQKTEYVLAGTLLSVFIAVISGLLLMLLGGNG